jgi:hypothetical protein
VAGGGKAREGIDSLFVTRVGGHLVKPARLGQVEGEAAFSKLVRVGEIVMAMEDKDLPKAVELYTQAVEKGDAGVWPSGRRQ